MNLNEYLENYIHKLNESKLDQQAFIDKFGKAAFDDFTTYKDRIAKIIINGKPASKDITYHTKNTSVRDMLELLARAKSREYSAKGKGQVLDVENKLVPLPVSNGQKFIKELNGFNIYAVYDYRNMIELGSNKYGGIFGKWCVVGRYAGLNSGITLDQIESGLVKVSQARDAFEVYMDKYQPKDPTTNKPAYIVVYGNNQKWCILIPSDLTQLTASDAENNKYNLYNWDDVYDNISDVLEFLHIAPDNIPNVNIQTKLEEKGSIALDFLKEEYNDEIKILNAEFDIEEDDVLGEPTPEFRIEISCSDDCDVQEVISDLNGLLKTEVEFLEYDWPEGAIIIY